MPNLLSIRGSKTGPDLAQKLGQKTEHFSKLPDSILRDHRLSASARCVYALLSGSCHASTNISIGYRRIGELLGFSRGTVSAALRNLKEIACISSSGGNKSRCTYVLMPTATIRPTAKADTKARLDPKMICPRCRQARFGLLRVGVCRACNLDLKLDRQIARKIDEKPAATA